MPLRNFVTRASTRSLANSYVHFPHMQPCVNLACRCETVGLPPHNLEPRGQRSYDYTVTLLARLTASDPNTIMRGALSGKSRARSRSNTPTPGAGPSGSGSSGSGGGGRPPVQNPQDRGQSG